MFGMFKALTIGLTGFTGCVFTLMAAPNNKCINFTLFNSFGAAIRRTNPLSGSYSIPTTYAVEGLLSGLGPGLVAST
jgi:hypothetical protein